MIPLYAAEERRVEVVEEARRWEKAGIISARQLEAVRDRYRPAVVRVGVFFRLLLAIFAAVAAIAVAAIPVLLFEPRPMGIAVLLGSLSLVFAWVADRQLIAGRRLYRCGAEEALLGLSVLFASGATDTLVHGVLGLPWQWGALSTHVVVLAATAWVAVRYGYALAALAAAVTLIILPVRLALAFGWPSIGVVRVAVFVLAGGLGVWSHRRLAHGRSREGELPSGYRWCLEVVRLSALAGLYVDANSFVHTLGLGRETVRLGLEPASRGGSWLCAFLTAGIPVAALALGIRLRERSLLWFGGLSGVASILTLKYFFHLGYVAEELTAAGAALAGIAFGLIRWLRAAPERTRGGFTAEPLLEPVLYGVDAEALAALQPLVLKAAGTAAEGFQPDGGEFGGGGATDRY